MTPQAALVELLDRLAAQQGAAVHIGIDELNTWPAEAVAAMKAARVLVKARHTTHMVCPGCERQCSKQVDIFPAEESRPARALIICNEPEDLGLFPVELHTLERWQVTGEVLAAALNRMLGFAKPPQEDSTGKRWAVGVLKGKKHRRQVTLLAGDNLTLSLAGHSVQLMDVLTFKQNALTLDEGELVRLVDQPAVDSEGSRAPGMKGNASGSGQGTSAIQCEVFIAMKNLAANEVSITFVGDKAESGIGANNMLEISARGKTMRVALAALDLVDRRRGALNSQGVILLGMAQKRKLSRTEPNSAKVTRLRKVFSKHIGIKDDPFDPYRQGVGWVPLFMIADKRGAADERAKREAERRTDSYEQMNEHGDRFADNDKTDQDLDLENSENELGADWLKNNDPDAPA